MRLEDNPDRGRKVWLTESEVDQLMNAVEDTEARIGFMLMVHSGLRTKEVLRAKPADIQPMDGDQDSYKLRVWEGKGDKYRETWIPDDLVQFIRGYTDGDDPEDPLISSSRRTFLRRLQSARETLQEDTGDDGWQYLSAHDLRRTWGTRAIEKDMAPTVIMQCGGWDDFRTFQRHYMGHHGDDVVAKEAAKVLR